MRDSQEEKEAHNSNELNVFHQMLAQRIKLGKREHQVINKFSWAKKGRHWH